MRKKLCFLSDMLQQGGEFKGGLFWGTIFIDIWGGDNGVWGYLGGFEYHFISA